MVVSVKCRGTLKRANRSRGKFRSFLLATLNHFLHSEWDRRIAQKRDERIVISLDQAENCLLSGLIIRNVCGQGISARALRSQQALTHAQLLELYDRLGQPRPGTETTQPRRKRQSG